MTMASVREIALVSQTRKITRLKICGPFHVRASRAKCASDLTWFERENPLLAS